MEESQDYDRQSILMQMNSKILSLGSRYLTPVSYLPPPDANKAMLFLKETVAVARQAFIQDGYDMWIEDCEELAILIEKSPWSTRIVQLLVPRISDVATPEGRRKLLRDFFWESKLTSEEGFSLEEAALITAGKALTARDPQSFLLRDASVRLKRVELATKGACPLVTAQEIEQAFGVWVRRGGELFSDYHHFQGFLNWRAQFVANALVSSEAEIPMHFEEIKAALRKELFPAHRAGFQYFGGLVDQKPEAIFDRFFEEWEAFVSNRLCS